MAARLPVALAAALLEDANLRSTRFTVDDADDFRVRDERSAGEHLAAVLLEEQHLIVGDLLADLGLHAIDRDQGPRRDLHLPSAGLNDCEHVTCPPVPPGHILATLPSGEDYGTCA